MSKVFETNALKGKSLASGMKTRIAELQKYGVKESDLTQMEQDADKAIEAIREGWPPCVSWGGGKARIQRPEASLKVGLNGMFADLCGGAFAHGRWLRRGGVPAT